MAGSGSAKTALVHNTGKDRVAWRRLGDGLLFFGTDSHLALKRNSADTPESRLAGTKAATGPRASPSAWIKTAGPQIDRL